MSLKTNYSKNFGPSRRNFDADTSLAPFEVIDVGDNKVAINEGVLIHGSSAIAYGDIDFTGACKPQNLMGGDVDSAKFLTVKKGDYVVVLLTDVDSSRPKAEIKAVAPADLDKEAYKRKANKVIKIAQILNQKTVEENTYLKIKNLHAGQIIADTENWPAFTPIIWPVEKLVEDDAEESEPPSVWKAVFIPGSVYLPQTMDECKVFSINGTTMLDLPIIEVKKGDKWYVTYEIDKKWKIKNTPTFTKTPGDREIEKVVPEGPECDMSTSTSDSPCSPKEGYFKLKVLEFVEKPGGGLHAKMYWKSDICIYGWERCPSECDGSEGGDSDSDSSGDSDSSDPPYVPPSESDGSDDSDSSNDPEPEDGCSLNLEITATCYGVMTSTHTSPSGGNPSGLGSACMEPGDTRACFLGSDFSEGGPGGYVKIIAMATATPESWSDCDICGTGGLTPVATLWVTVGSIKGSNVIDLNVGGMASVCAIVPGSPCGTVTATAYITVSTTVEDQNPNCTAELIAETTTAEVKLPPLGITTGSPPDEVLECGDCETTPNPEGP